MIWTPWDHDEVLPERLPIDEPPCKDCFYWYPRNVAKFDPKRGKLTVAGVILCNAETMCKDFSCYKDRKKDD